MVKGLKPSEITRDVIVRAKAIERAWDGHAENRVLEMGGSWNGRRKQVRIYPEDQIVLTWLRRNRHPVSRTELVLNLDLSKNEITSALDRLVPRGSVSRTSDGKYAAR